MKTLQSIGAWLPLLVVGAFLLATVPCAIMVKQRLHRDFSRAIQMEREAGVKIR